ncbi:hypothetical protein [Micromonospora sp. KC207]|uniref:hypothetical protein n=1 Tax=Micromonospora sp. KC207 TaxID=2530377 RepID=UPI0014055A2E|nr:hypothetical protein [Micromonospora sp. KC207]
MSKKRPTGIAMALAVAVGNSLTLAAPAQAATPAIQTTKVCSCSRESSGNYTNC